MAESWPAGRYVLVVDDYETPTGQIFRWGDVLDRDAEIAQLMGEAGAIAPEGSPEAEQARKPSQVLAAEALELRARALAWIIHEPFRTDSSVERKGNESLEK